MAITPTLARRYTIGGISILGGLAGFAALAPVAMGQLTLGWRLLAIAVVLFYALCFVAGVLLIRDDDRGASLCLYLQFPQLVVIQTDVLFYKLFCGFGIHAGIADDFSLTLGFQTLGQVALIATGNDLDKGSLSLNIVAAVIMSQLFKYLEAKESANQPISVPTLGGTV